MRGFLILLLAFASMACAAQEPEKYNLGFENQSEGASLSNGWFKWGDYELTIDTLAHSGQGSGKIRADGTGSSFGSIAYKIPANFTGKTIQLQGYMTIKNVANGFAGLLLRVDGDDIPLAFDNMQGQNITGTKDWQRYTITLNYPSNAETIILGGILSGKGEAWFDDFVLTIDGKNVQQVKVKDKQLPKARLDKAYDNGSLVEFPDLNPKKIENLDLLGRVWGFLKYHHPKIAEGTYHWDYELFRFLPGYMEAATDVERDNLLVNWINSLGKIRKCKTCGPIPNNAFLKPDLTWMENQSGELRNRLEYVYHNRAQGKHHYIAMAPHIGNPEFKNENPYGHMPYPDAGFRLLALYRYWNMINYFFPYKHLMDADWNEKLREYIPLFLTAKDELAYELAAIQMIGGIQDTHANLWGGADQIDAWRGAYYPPVHLRYIEDQWVVADYYKAALQTQAGLKIGDRITRIKGRPIEEMVKEVSKYYPASNEPSRRREIGADLLRSNTDTIQIEFVTDNGKPQKKTLRLYPKDSLDIYRWYKDSDMKSFRMLGDNIGYVTLQNITEADIPQIKRHFKATRGIVVDIRNYPSTFVPYSLGSYFVSSSTPFVKFTLGTVDHPGAFTFTNNLEIPSQGRAYNGKLVVLVNEHTQSQAEFTAMAFRAGENTTILGSTTAGADGNVSEILLPGGLRTFFSGIGVYYPNGEETQRVGIVPDIEVKPTIEGIRNGKDELLQKAVQMIMEH
jgi:C-terminal processing protease CtpA/Prc